MKLRSSLKLNFASPKVLVFPNFVGWHGIAGNGQVFAMAGLGVPSAGTNADCCFIIEDMICRLIFNVQPEPMPNKILLTIYLRSSPAIANTRVVCLCLMLPIKTFSNTIVIYLNMLFTAWIYYSADVAF